MCLPDRDANVRIGPLGRYRGGGAFRQDTSRNPRATHLHVGREAVEALWFGKTAPGRKRAIGGRFVERRRRSRDRLQPLADQQSGRKGFLLLRQPAPGRLTLLRRS